MYRDWANQSRGARSSYDSCDVGVLPNQTYADGVTPEAATKGGGSVNGYLSYQPGQRLSSCTCKGEDHPGPSHKIGRGAPEIDILEAIIENHDGVRVGKGSQSAQIAPYDAGYKWDTETPATTIYDHSM